MSTGSFDAITARPSVALPALLQDYFSPALIATLILVLIIPICISIWLSTSSSSRRNAKSVVLLGPSGSGKTYLFSKLLFGATRPTQTSLTENRANVPYLWSAEAQPHPDLPEGALPMPQPIKLIDTPGHPRLRARALAKELSAATGAILLIDGTTGLTAKNIRATADSLHLLLGLRSFLPTLKAFPVLVLLTKVDSSPVLMERAKLTLGREMERRRQAASSGLANKIEGLAAESSRGKELPSDENEILQADIWNDKPWTWDQELDLGGVQVTWAATNLDQAEGSRQVYEWMGTC